MSIKLKAFALGLLAALAVGGVSVVSAGADSGGHFTSDSTWTHVTASQEGALHSNVFINHDLEDSFTCTTVNYTANVSGKTATEITVSPTYAGCEATEGKYPLSVNMNECHLLLTFTDIAAAKHHTVHLVCPAGKEVKFSINPPIIGECHVRIPPQTPTTGGIAYNTIERNGKHALTLQITVEGITSAREETGFGCAGAGGESNNSTLSSALVAEGKDTAGSPTNITVTTASS